MGRPVLDKKECAPWGFDKCTAVLLTLVVHQLWPCKEFNFAASDHCWLSFCSCSILCVIDLLLHFVGSINMCHCAKHKLSNAGSCRVMVVGGGAQGLQIIRDPLARISCHHPSIYSCKRNTLGSLYTAINLIAAARLLWCPLSQIPTTHWPQSAATSRVSWSSCKLTLVSWSRGSRACNVSGMGLQQRHPNTMQFVSMFLCVCRGRG